MNQKDLEKLVNRETQAAILKILGESEEEKQKKTAAAVSQLKVEAEEDTDKDSPKVKKKSANKIRPEKTAADLVDVTLDKVVDKLNMMRSGKSANDEEVKKNLDEYFKSLTMGERQSLFVFLDALNQIMTAGVEGKEAPEPDEQGIDTDPVRPGSKKSVKPSSEKDSIIVVGESQDKKEILEFLREMKK